MKYHIFTVFISYRTTELTIIYLTFSFTHSRIFFRRTVRVWIIYFDLSFLVSMIRTHGNNYFQSIHTKWQSPINFNLYMWRPLACSQTHIPEHKYQRVKLIRSRERLWWRLGLKKSSNCLPFFLGKKSMTTRAWRREHADKIFLFKFEPPRVHFWRWKICTIFWWTCVILSNI